MKIEKAAVIGAGAMGSGIAQVLSQAGIKVVLKDVKDEFVERGGIEDGAEGLVPTKGQKNRNS